MSSLRLDAVLAAMLHISRGDAVQLVKSGMVEVNHVSTASAHYEVFENDVFSIRGRGKYKLCGVCLLYTSRCVYETVRSPRRYRGRALKDI